MPKSKYAREMTLNFFCRNSENVSRPNTSLYLALFETNPSLQGATEASYNTYTRKPVSFDMNSTSLSTFISNSANIEFGIVPNDYPVDQHSIAYAALMTTSTVGTGEIVYWGDLVTQYKLNPGVQPIIQTGALSISES